MWPGNPGYMSSWYATSIACINGGVPSARRFRKKISFSPSYILPMVQNREHCEFSSTRHWIWTCAYHWLRSLLNNGILLKRPDTVHHASGNENLPILWCVYFCLWSQRHLHPAFDDVVDFVVGIMPMWWDTERDVVRCGVQLRSYYLDAHDPIAVFQKGLWTTSSVTRVPVQISVQMDLDLPSWCHLRGL